MQESDDSIEPTDNASEAPDRPVSRRRFLGMSGSTVAKTGIIAGALSVLGIGSVLFKRADDQEIQRRRALEEQQEQEKIQGFKGIIEKYLNREENPIFWQMIDNPNSKVMPQPRFNASPYRKGTEYDLWAPEVESQSKSPDVWDSVERDVEGNITQEQVRFKAGDQIQSLSDMLASLNKFFKYKPDHWVTKETKSGGSELEQITLDMMGDQGLATGGIKLPDGRQIGYRVWKDKTVGIDVGYPANQY